MDQRAFQQAIGGPGNMIFDREILYSYHRHSDSVGSEDKNI